MNEELIKFLVVFVMVIVPFTFLMWAIAKQLNEHEDDIKDLKLKIFELQDRINELEDKN